VTITSEPDEVCFDAALFLDLGMAVVDCAKKGGKLFSSYTNYWYIMDLTSHTLKKKVSNDIFINFQSITRRKLLKFNHP
jgi:hypothetical protein